MIHFDQKSLNNNNNNNNNKNQFNSQKSLKKSDLYSPHPVTLPSSSSSSNASHLMMNRQSTATTINKLATNSPFVGEHTSSDPEFYHNSSASSKNNNNFDDEIYDFDNFQQQAKAANLSDDDEEDINFDYEYGFDYDKVIKERLKIANQAFVSENLPSKRKPILVSFDNAVTAIDIPTGGEADSDCSKPPTPTIINNNALEKSSSSSLQTTPVQQQHDAAKPKKKVTLFGSEPTTTNNAATSSSASSVSKLPLNDTVEKEDPNRFANMIKDAIQRYDAEMNGLNNDDTTTTNNNSSIDETLNRNRNINSGGGGGGDIDTDSDEDLSARNKIRESPDPVLRFNTKNNTDNNNKFYNSKIVHIVSDTDVVEEIADLTTPSLSAKSNKQNNEFSFKPFTSSPSVSPILVVLPKQQSPDQQKSVKTASKKDEKDGNKMLIEKDGIFELMSPEEYLAYEQKRAAEIKAKRPQRPPSSSSNSNKSSSNITRLPPAPAKATTLPRPKTSNDIDRRNNNNNRNKYVTTTTTNQQSKSQITSTLSNSSNNSNLRHMLRNSHSAEIRPSSSAKDASYKSFSPIRQHRTPEYAQNYQSPYHMESKVYKPLNESAEAKRLHEREEEERKRNNELAFVRWLESKEKQRVDDQKRKHTHEKKTSSTEMSSSTNSNSNNSQDERNNKIAFSDWLKLKEKQLQRQREYERQMELFDRTDKHRVSPEERSKAFKEWHQRKLKEKQEQLKVEKLENKKWIARRRRSRKHQRLSQAIEMAQAYGYTNSYNLSGFNF